MKNKMVYNKSLVILLDEARGIIEQAQAQIEHIDQNDAHSAKVHLDQAKTNLIDADEKINSLHRKIDDLERELEQAITKLWEAKRGANTKEQKEAHITDVIDIIARVRTEIQGDILGSLS